MGAPEADRPAVLQQAVGQRIHGWWRQCCWFAQCRLGWRWNGRRQWRALRSGGLNNSGNDLSGAGKSAKVLDAPGTNTAGTPNSAGSTGGTGARGSITTGTAGNRAGGTSTGRIDGTTTPGPSMPGDAEIRAEDPKVDQKIKSICKGC